ncbi:unnamed protein product [marine sediment metagenome]|uniref:Nuclease associated modular domain-containing protein n=1 Tax=marine sediment metagenome TaxID=412755 RepID=X1CV97_9ZZZZ
MKGKHHSEKTKRKISESKLGTIIGEEWRHKISVANKGRKGSFYGKHHSAESKLLMSSIKLGKVVFSEERHLELERLAKRNACRIIYDSTKELKSDPDSLFNDPEFVEAYVGVTCKRIKKKIK